MMKNLAMIACISEDGGLGQNGELLWHIPDDMKFFRQTTTGHPVVMGGKTWTSIGRRLPNRENIVLSRHAIEDPEVRCFSEKTKLMDYLNSLADEKFIIGGASLYEMFLSEAEVLYLTEVAGRKPADVYFPKFDRSKYDSMELSSGDYRGVPYRILKYQRKNYA